MDLKKVTSALLPLCLITSLSGCGDNNKPQTTATADPTAPATQDIPDAKTFLENAQAELFKKQTLSAAADWAYSTNIIKETADLSAYHGEQYSNLAASLAKKAAMYDNAEVDADTRRKLNLLKNGLNMPAPDDEKLSGELASIGSELQGAYGKGKYCRSDDECWSLPDMTLKMATERDEPLLREIWEGWREVSVPMKDQYTRQIDIATMGAKELGFKDVSELWRSKYDMPAEEFPGELDRLWGQVKPFYEALHCHVRAELSDYYGEEVVPQDKAIPAHLLGNMWAQQWGNIYDLVKPEGDFKAVDVTKALVDAEYDEIKMVKSGEEFFTSLGFDPLPETFWERSMFVKPDDRDVVCHASAWDLDDADDIRIKMCIQITGDEFQTIHHEIGHNIYQRAYKDQPLVYRGSANDGFHEAIGDTIGLSITPKYLKQIGLIDEVPEASNDIAALMQLALDKIAFLPFGLMVDQWRWKVMSGEVDPKDYNKLWWELREKYQGVRAPVERRADHFDPGAKYHVPANVAYTRYFLAHILQFQFHKALCDIAGDKGPVHQCTIYGNKEAGKRLDQMLTMGMSKPWPDALEALTGKREMDGTAILAYFSPLKDWLDEQNKDRKCGW